MMTSSPTRTLETASWKLALQRLRGGLRLGRGCVISIPTFWLALFFLIPFAVVFKISLSDAASAIPPYSALLQWDPETAMARLQVSFDNYLLIFTDPFYLDAYLNSIKIAAISTLLTLVVAFPMAYVIARSQGTRRVLLLSLVILPFWTSFLLRVYAWLGILNKHGVINNALMALGLIDHPHTLLQTDFAVYVGIVYSYLPFMILPLYSALEKLDMSLLEAAEDLGCRPLQRFWLVTVPLSLPGIIAGCLLVFIPAVGEFVIPSLLGSSNTLMIGRMLWEEFFLNRDWPQAAAVAILMLLFLVAPIMLYRNARVGKEGA